MRGGKVHEFKTAYLGIDWMLRTQQKSPDILQSASQKGFEASYNNKSRKGYI
jgi:hypothetical protein